MQGYVTTPIAISQLIITRLHVATPNHTAAVN